VKLTKRNTETQSIIDNANKEDETDLSLIKSIVNIDKIISTGSTLLDLAISGKRRTGGRLPGGIIVEIFGPSGSGKTAILSEICGNVQVKGGSVRLRDPEARLDKEYAEIYGIDFTNKFFDYARPKTVSEIFDDLFSWKPKNENIINVYGGDSLAALSTDMEMDDEDKMGMRRAKEFSQGLRKTCKKIADNNWLIVLTNQVRQGKEGETTPGGEAVKFYSSLRIRIGPAYPSSKIKKKIKVNIDGTEKEIEKIIGINSTCKIAKSSVDEPHREAPLSIIFGYGIDDVRTNLQYVKDMTGKSMYDCFTKEWKSMDNAIRYIEENNLESGLKERVIEIWEKVESSFDMNRKRKAR